MDEIRKLDNRLEQEQYLGKVRKMTGFSMDSLSRQLDAADADDGVENVPVPERVYSAVEKAALYLLHAYVNRRPYVDPTLDLSEFIADDALRTVYEAFRDDPALTVAQAYRTLPETLHSTLGEAADDTQGIGEELAKEYYAGCLDVVRRASLEAEIKDLSEQYDAAAFSDRKKELLQRILALQTQLNNLVKP